MLAQVRDQLRAMYNVISALRKNVGEILIKLKLKIVLS